MTIYHVLYLLIIAVVGGAVYLIKRAYRVQSLNIGGGAQPAVTPAGPQAPATQQPAGGGPKKQFVGFAFLGGAAVALPAAYYLPYPWNGIAFVAIATAIFFRKMRHGTKDITSWEEVWGWLTKEIPVYGRLKSGMAGKKVIGVSYRRISGFVVAEAFVLAFFEAFFGYIVPGYPSVVLAFFLAILWFIGTGAAESLVDKIAQRFSYALLTAVAGSAVVITLYLFYFRHVEQRMMSVAFVALVLGSLGIYLRYRENKEAKTAGLVLLVMGGIGLLAVATDIVSALGDAPMKQTVDQVREYQRGERKNIDVRFLPQAKTEPASEPPALAKTESAPASQAGPDSAPPVRAQQALRVEVIVKHEARPSIPAPAQTAPKKKEELTFEQVMELVEYDNKLYNNR
ncbi:MAG: hypothetical protein Q7S09_04930 [bacterium]|nr:hypothetical protein [bacterium]